MKNENFKLILNGLMILLGTSALVYGLTNLIPIRYHFNSNIWGTVSDWMIIFITLVTAVFLYKTLRSQQEVQKMQQRLTDIEDFKFRNELLPYFEIKGVPPVYSTTEIHTKYHILNTGKPARNLVVRTEARIEGRDTVSKEWKQTTINNSQKLDIHQTLDTSGLAKHFEIRVTMIFEDQAQNRYMQYAEIIKPSEKIQSFGERTLPSLIHKEI